MANLSSGIKIDTVFFALNIKHIPFSQWMAFSQRRRTFFLLLAKSDRLDNQISLINTEFKVTGLSTNQQKVFATAAAFVVIVVVVFLLLMILLMKSFLAFNLNALLHKRCENKYTVIESWEYHGKQRRK